MNRIVENYENELLIAPVSIASGGNATSEYVDMSDCSEFEVIVAHGVVASSKTVTVELLAADNIDGTEAVSLKTAADGTEAGGLIAVDVNINSLRGPFYAVKITHDDTNAVITSATVIKKSKWSNPVTNATVIL